MPPGEPALPPTGLGVVQDAYTMRLVKECCTHQVFIVAEESEARFPIEAGAGRQEILSFAVFV